METKIICFANNKGGSGKTTTCSNVAYCLTAQGHKTLVVDGDMQLNLSLSFLDEDRVLELSEGGKNLFGGMEAEKDLKEFIVHTPYEGLDLLPSSLLMSGVEEMLSEKGGREDVLLKGLSGVRGSGDYDYILIDTPPTLGLWVRNILFASDGIVVPVEASPWGLFGLANMISYIEAAVERNSHLAILGIALTKVNIRKKYFRQTKEFLSEMDDIHVFDTVIRVDSNVEWAQDNSKPVTAYRKSARSSGEYRKLAQEIIDRAEKVL